VDKTIGEFGVYGHDSGVWPKDILADEHGVTPLLSPPAKAAAASTWARMGVTPV